MCKQNAKEKKWSGGSHQIPSCISFTLESHKQIPTGYLNNSHSSKSHSINATSFIMKIAVFI